MARTRAMSVKERARSPVVDVDDLPQAKRPRRKAPRASSSSKSVRIFREIRQAQQSTDLLLTKLPFQRLVREIVRAVRSDFRMSSDALLALQAGCEAHLINIIGNAYICSIHAKRVTLMQRDIQLAMLLMYGGVRCSFMEALVVILNVSFW